MRLTKTVVVGLPWGKMDLKVTLSGMIGILHK